jgi:hypothetical protein
MRSFIALITIIDSVETVCTSLLVEETAAAPNDVGGVVREAGPLLKIAGEFRRTGIVERLVVVRSEIAEELRGVEGPTETLEGGMGGMIGKGLDDRRPNVVFTENPTKRNNANLQVTFGNQSNEKKNPITHKVTA